MSDADEIEMETRRRSLAVEGAMLMLIDGLAARGTISADEAEDMLRILSKSSDSSAARAASSLRIVNQLKRLRRGDGAITPGA
ncbi:MULTISPECIES: hypothetical protein [Neorhizobium]|jgi:hypothetical protein|uniref:ANTAR domain-containing protein n=2 Tax=Neorhizobium galegae TaxID=399 RepID=A0A068ST62_NEOGA|nr:MULTISPECIES: hypothetical protein [Neorhizobium]CDN49064.1 Hypothetical protein RG540_CH28980 [Neorhizobium galegae bv. orientalis str. HAMBI 540]CDZ35010.1 Hypothetical protein NGAL_HAMBI1145_26170 [Neorhizobium galegae bv. officinalis]CDZ48942.1 Hypothetical protein NGAL_HAMBI1189_26810 [Neorhizobium galegae bv. officinalis]CDZ50576.1 Hypothetical protein NGAL_HAMBI2427_37230 [Neorhizobium galegae bv. orientalis]